MSNLDKHDFNEHLIDEVRKENAIWGMSSHHYKSQLLKEVAWRRIATAMSCNVPRETLSCCVMKKVKSLSDRERMKLPQVSLRTLFLKPALRRNRTPTKLHGEK
ncbi:hypothetical protein MTO96_044370 [Rhipicephalus appendiculatus]